MSKQMRSIFDFERVCKNCKYFDTGVDEPGQGCFHPDKGIVFVEFEDTCELWEFGQKHGEYIVADNGQIMKQVKGE